MSAIIVLMGRFTYEEDRGRRLGPDTELRVHGVGGSSPESLLYEHHPVLVGGDEIAGFYRPQDREQITEAYAWGGLTARSSVRALWITLLPFALVNVAGWMIAGRAGDHDSSRLVKSLVRMIAIGSTVALTALVASISVDIFALQCGGQELCAGRSVWLQWMRSSILLESPMRLVLVGLMPVIVSLILLWLLSRSTSKRYEARFVLSERTVDAGISNGLAQPMIWQEVDNVRSLAFLHLASAFALLAAATRWTAFRVERYSVGLIGEWDGPLSLWLEGWNSVLWLSLAVLIAIVVMAGFNDNVAIRTARLGLYIAAALLLAAVIDGARDRSDSVDIGFIGTWFSGFMWSVVFPALIALIFALLVVLSLSRIRWIMNQKQEDQHNASPVAMAGLGPAVVVSIGLIAMTSVLGGLALAIAEMLGSRRSTPGEAFISVFTDWEVVALGLLVYLGVIGLWLAWRWTQLTRPDDRTRRIERIESRWFARAGVKPPTSRDPEHSNWLRRVDRMEQVRSEWIPTLDRPLWIGVVAAVAMAILYLLDREVLGGDIFHKYVFIERHRWTEALLVLAGWFIVLLPGIAWLLLWRSFRDPNVRRTVGTLWDVLTFWPRWFHPFAPPPYTARAVPELVTRLRERLVADAAEGGDSGDRVVLSAHSQGSVIAVAAILQLAVREEADSDIDSPLSHIALLTHGSPLASLYGRFFPAFFDQKCLIEIRELLTHHGRVRWRNLYRLTDPIGQRLFNDEVVDIEVGDPPSDLPHPGDPLPSPRGHSHYYLDPLYWRTVEDLFAQIPAR